MKRREEANAAVARDIARHRLFEGVRRLGLAVSGGADSVALLHLMMPLCREAGIEAVVLHLDHGLRGAASAADRDFVRELAGAAGLRCRTAEGAVPRGRGKSLEMAARELRLAFYRACARAEHLDAIATGHHADDVVETLLLRLARGAGATGLAGLRPVSLLGSGPGRLRLIRPLLSIRRETLRSWLRTQGLTWREDASNLDTGIARNAVRRLLPLMEQVWRGFIDRVARSAEILRAEDDYLEGAAAEWLRAQGDLAGLALDRLTVLPLAMQRRVLRAWLIGQGHEQAIGFETVERLLAQASRRAPRQMLLSGHLRVRRQGDRLVVVKDAPHSLRIPGERVLPVPGAIVWGDVRAVAKLAPGVTRESGRIGRLPAACSLNPVALAGRALVLRARRPGDRIGPLGMRGTRKLQDILVDAKVPEEARDRLPLLTCGGQLVWVPGYRVAREFAVSDPDAPAVQICLKRVGRDACRAVVVRRRRVSDRPPSAPSDALGSQTRTMRNVRPSLSRALARASSTKLTTKLATKRKTPGGEPGRIIFVKQ
ncbi:MAG: tRNA lysidine(34) synthetase TilS [Kiritimatiellae bacterium]|nr:tRNA lysidine(34) synthetase TilS [Kiritimatiellia bacterium]